MFYYYFLDMIFEDVVFTISPAMPDEFFYKYPYNSGLELNFME